MDKDQCSVNSIRKSILHMTCYSRASHVGSCLSTVEILYVLYNKVMKIDPATPEDPQRDKFILSKGHASAALYAVLAEVGFFPRSYLEKYYSDGGVLPGHVDKEAVPGLDVSSGALGHGLPIGVGLALANLRQGNPGRVYVLLGDGECNEGSVWEAAMLASHLRLSNLTAIVDVNRLQGFGFTQDVIRQDNLQERWQSFGWETSLVDGHDLAALERVFNMPKQGPKVLIAQTVKGKGVSFMENRLEWHYKSLNQAQYDQAICELDGND